MASSRELDSYVYRMGTAPNTRVAVSQKNKVYSYQAGAKKFQQIGVVSEFSVDESRTIEAVRGIGFGDQVAELVPGVTEPLTMTLNRTLLYYSNIFQTLGYKGGIEGLVRSLRHHRWPFDIKNELVFSELSSALDVTGTSGFKPAVTQPLAGASNMLTTAIKALFTFYEGCWINSYSTSFTADAAIVAENTSVTVTDVIDGYSNYGEYIDSGLSPVTQNGTAGSGYSLRFAGGVGASTSVGTGV